MIKETEIWRFAAERLKLNESVMLLVVAESSGSSPGRQGFKMVVAPDEMRGSIGGGVMEVALVELAKGKIKKAKGKIEAEVIEQVHQKNAPNASGMICSGMQTVLLFPLNSNHFSAVTEIIAALENGQQKQLLINNSTLIIIDPEANSPEFDFTKLADDGFVYEERIGVKNRLYLVGGGHCALALSELMSKLDFHITLFDDRNDLNTLEKNEFAHEIRIIESYEKIADLIESGADVYVVVMTLGYKFDEIVIRRLFDKNFKYFGVLGSRAKMKTLLRELEKEGFEKEKLAQIRTPIGLDIRSRTPEEIAVSIAAEIIAVKNGAIVDMRKRSMI